MCAGVVADGYSVEQASASESPVNAENSLACAACWYFELVPVLKCALPVVLRYQAMLCNLC